MNRWLNWINKKDKYWIEILFFVVVYETTVSSNKNNFYLKNVIKWIFYINWLQNSVNKKYSKTIIYEILKFELF